jgi:hypothetical protein
VWEKCDKKIKNIFLSQVDFFDLKRVAAAGPEKNICAPETVYRFGAQEVWMFKRIY